LIKSLIFSLFIVLLPSADLYSQELISWQDLLNTETTRDFERVQVGADSLQFADLWLPDGEAPHPVAIVIHGGCWQSMYPGVALTNPMAEELAENGFAVWNIEYRRLGHDGGGYPGTFLDVANAADHLQNIAADYDLDLERVIAAGHSAGGHLATWLAARENISPESPLYAEQPLKIDRVISLAGINDLENYADYGASPCGHQTVEQLVDIENRPKPFADTSPSELLPFHAEHIEIVAAFDAPVPPFLGRNFVKQADEKGAQTELILQPEAGHYEMTAPGTDEWQQVLSIFLRDL